MLRKPERVKSKENLERCRALPCVACIGERVIQIYPTECDHLTTRGSGGGDEQHNLLPNCTLHHTERHKIGILTFAKKYQSVRVFLELMGRTDILDRIKA